MHACRERGAAEAGWRQRRTCNVVARETSQLLMSSLKVAQAGLHPALVNHDDAQKTYDKSVTAATSHAPMGPYVAAAAVGLAHHASRAASSAARVAKE